ncbi:MAG TPA: DUF4197 domain-containing protein [bacterium]|nr:DUF4197 domain-containing protein [bacterium]
MLRCSSFARRRFRSVPIAIAGLALLPACAGFDPGSLGDILESSGPLDDATIVSGLREALNIGTQRASASVSRTDGYFGNARIRIPLPQELDSAASTLRQVGLGSHVDDFELAMNRAAEAAAGEAVDVFWSAIKSMTIADARGILNGPDTAATAYFRRTTEAQLEARFAPIVDEKMTTLGTVRVYDQLVSAYDALPLTTKPAFDPRAYVTDRALNGLFTVLGDEEKRIREDPLARTTALLRKVFGQ